MIITNNRLSLLVDLDRRVDLVNKVEAGEVADSAGEHKEEDTDKEHVSKEEKARDEADDF